MAWMPWRFFTVTEFRCKVRSFNVRQTAEHHGRAKVGATTLAVVVFCTSALDAQPPDVAAGSRSPGAIRIELAEELVPDGRVPFHGFAFDKELRMIPLGTEQGWAKLFRYTDKIEVICLLRGMQQGRAYQPRIVGWNNPSRCKGNPRDRQSASCSQLSDDTQNNPDADQFHASFRGIIGDHSGDAALRLELKVGEGMPPMKDPFAPAHRDTNVFWGSHFKGRGLTNPMHGEFFLLLIDKGPPTPNDIENYLRSPLYGCRSEPGSGGPENCVFWRRSLVGASPGK
jgi:hypothetical protein